MKVNLISFLIVIFSTYTSCEITRLSEYYKDVDLPLPCSANDLQINGCLKEYLQSFWNKTANAYGSEKLHLPPLDPFALAERKWSFKNSLFELAFLTKNVKIYNMAETTMHKVKVKFNNTDKILVDTGKLSIELDMSNPEVIIEGDFKVNLRIDQVKLRPKGHFKLKIEKNRNYVKVIGKSEKRDGYHYLIIKSVNFEPEIKDFHFEIQNAYSNENSLIDAFVMDFFHNNVKDVYKDFIRDTRPQWQPIFLEVMNEFSVNFPIELVIAPQ